MTTITEAKLEAYARRWLVREGKERDDGERGAFRDLMRGGCASGIVGELIYYHDTTKFFRRHRKAIEAMLTDVMNDCGFHSPSDLFGDKWDKSDPFVREDSNQNLLAWFGFEEAARRVANRERWDA